MAVYADFAGVDVVESLEEADDGCFAAARSAYDADALASEDFEVETAEDWEFGTGGVGESNVLEFDGNVIVIVVWVWFNAGRAVDGWLLGAEV